MARSSSTPMKRWDERLVTALFTVGACGGLMALTAAFVWGGRVALSIGAGAAIAVSNLFLLSNIVGAMMGGGGSRRAGTWGLLAAVKMVVLFGGIWIVMTKGLVDPMGIFVGYVSLPIGIAIGSIVSDKTGLGT